MRFQKACMIAAALFLAGCFSQSYPIGPDFPETAYKKISFADKIATSDERTICEEAGGSATRAGLLGAEYCAQTYPDAGATCQDGSECLGDCRLAIDDQQGRKLNWPGKNRNKTRGMCQAVDLPFGCHQNVRNGEAEPDLCVD